MSFLGIYRAIYAYAPQTDEELALKEGDLLYILEKSTEDSWWKAKKKASPTDDEEPIGLIPNTYIEEAAPIGKLRALYDYQRQTEEELSFSEDNILDVYDSSDPDWSLVGTKGEYGFAPANYLEKADDAASPAASSPSEPAPPPLPTRQPAAAAADDDYDEEPESPVRPSPAAAVAAALQSRQRQMEAQSPPPVASPVTYTPPPQQKSVHFTPEASDDDEGPPPRLPNRPPSEISSVYASPTSPHPPTTFDEIEAAGMHRFPVDEIVNKKKIPCILELGNGKISLIPQKRSVPKTTWDIEDMQTYSADGKHVGLDLVSPIRSLDLRAENKDTASEIIRDLGEMRGAVRAAGLKEVMVAATSGGKKLGIILYDFDAQGSDEVSVSVGDEVVILDDTQSDEWWNVRRTNNGKEGVVPSSYIEVKKPASFEPPSPQEASSSSKGKSSHQHTDSVGPGINLPKRGSSLTTTATSSSSSSRRPTGRTATNDKPKPNPKKVRTWTDRSGTFKVEAEFINLRDGVIHLHKVNGVKIAVPVAKMSKQDLEYVERETGLSLDEDKPLSDLRGRGKSTVSTAISGGSKSTSGITIDRSKSNGATSQQEDYWFEFFLSTGVDAHTCQRYAANFAKDNMDEAILPEINMAVLRTLGLKEGDILRVMKFLDTKYGRKEVTGSGEGQKSLFTNADGGLKNNTRRERPAPGVQTSDVVDGKLLEQRKDSPEPMKKDTDPWAPKPSKKESTESPKPASPAPQQVAAAPAQTQAQPTPKPPPTGALRELSLLDEPLKPTVASPSPPAVTSPPAQPSSAPPQQTWQPPPPNILAAPLSVYQQPPASNNPTSPQYVNYQESSVLVPQHTAVPLQFQQTGLQQQIAARQRPTPPQIVQSTGALAPPPPPQRPQSAPGHNLQPQMQPLMPAITGFQNNASIAPPGQLSMQQLQLQQQQAQFQQQLQAQQALQQQQALQPQMTALPNNFGVPNINYPGLAMQPTGYGQPQQMGFNNGLLPQPTGTVLGQPLPPPFKPTVDLSLPTSLVPQHTAVPVQQPNGFGSQPGLVNKNLMPALTPLKPQATGPAPNVKFGVTPGKLAPQPTGIRKANLKAATPENPFGF